MQVQEMLEDLYEASGNEKKLSPYTDGTFNIANAGSIRMLAWLNRGYRLISKLKMPDGTPVRFEAVEAEMFFKTVTVTANATAGTASTITIDAGGAADVFNGWLMELSDGTGEGQVRLITDYTAAGVAYPHFDFATTPDATTDVTLYKRHMRLANSADADAAYHITMPAANSVVNILKIEDLGQTRELAYGGRTQSYPNGLVSNGRPTGYVRFGNAIYFDVAPNEEIWYRMEYERELAALVNATDEPLLPDQWQEILWLWLVWKARTWAFEPNAAYGAKRDFFDFLRSIQLPHEMEFERQDASLKLEME